MPLRNRRLWLGHPIILCCGAQLVYMPGLLQLRANLAADISHVVSFREVKLDFELYYKNML